MKEIFSSMKPVLLSILFIIATATVSGQTGGMPEELTKSPVRDQLNYIENRTRIYENFRAIREDIFQKLKNNLADTLTSMQKRITGLNKETAALNTTIDSLNSSLTSTKTDLDNVTKSKNSISLFGMEVEKGTYNTIMWSIIIILLALLLFGFLVFQRNNKVVVNRNKDLEDLKNEFEGYRKTSREAREKMALQHFNELKKLRGE